jgi:hypothetical protein
MTPRNIRVYSITPSDRKYLQMEMPQSWAWSHSTPAETFHSREIRDVVRVEISQEEWLALVRVWNQHHAVMTNPAVREAWLQYRMLSNLVDPES